MNIYQGAALGYPYTPSGKFPHSRRDQEMATCVTEGKTSKPVGYYLICCVVVALIILGDPVTKKPCEVSILSVQTQLKEGLLDVADYCETLFAET